MKFSKHLLGCLILIISIITACKKDKIITDSSAKLALSVDSVLFDTVFTTVGSTTKLFTIHNKNKQPVNISQIYLATGNASQFRINVDGVSGIAMSNVEIEPGDSLFVFVQVTVNPTGQNTPLLVMDSIVFETNGNIQKVILTAIGQDVYLHKPDHFPTNGLPPYSIIDCSQPWPTDKPHLIFGYAVVDEGATLTIPQGARVHLANRAVLWVYDGGTLKVQGAKNSEVIFQGARLEPDYKEVAGQWGKIWLSAGSKDNEIDWAIIKNGSIGVQADTLGNSTNPTLRISNTIIRNMSAAAIYGQGSYITGYNCVFANCGQYVGAFTIGGRYRFDHCTFANYWSESSRSTPLLALNNYYVDYTNTLQIRNLDSAYFVNCILHGDLDEEIGLDSSEYGGIFSYKFDHCIVKSELNMNDDGLHYYTVFPNADPAFKDVSANDYHLTVNSFAIDKGITSPYPNDLDDKFRPNNQTTSLPDIGAYEYY